MACNLRSAWQPKLRKLVGTKNNYLTPKCPQWQCQAMLARAMPAKAMPFTGNGANANARKSNAC